MDGILQTHLPLGPGLDQDWDLGLFLQGKDLGEGKRKAAGSHETRGVRADEGWQAGAGWPGWVGREERTRKVQTAGTIGTVAVGRGEQGFHRRMWPVHPVQASHSPRW